MNDYLMDTRHWRIAGAEDGKGVTVTVKKVGKPKPGEKMTPCAHRQVTTAGKF
jgi:hypothetical protein